MLLITSPPAGARPPELQELAKALAYHAGTTLPASLWYVNRIVPGNPERTWKAVFYLFGLFMVMGAVFFVLDHGIDIMNGIMFLIGAPIVWIWHQEDRTKKYLEGEIEAIRRELIRRGETTN